MSSDWLDGNVGGWFLRSLSYEATHPLLSWATSGQSLHHGDIVCLRGDTGTGKTLILTQILAEFLMPEAFGGFGSECLLLLGNESITPHLLKEQITKKLKLGGNNSHEDALNLESVVTQSLRNLFVFSVNSVTQLQQFAKSLPKLLNEEPLKCCRVLVVDDLDLGITWTPQFAPQLAQLTDAVHLLLHAATRQNLLMFYGLNKRLGSQTQTHTQNISTRPSDAATKVAGEPPGVQTAHCHTDTWRAPRKFILHLFRDPRPHHPPIYNWQPSHFICTSDSEGKSCILSVERNGHCTILTKQ